MAQTFDRVEQKSSRQLWVDLLAGPVVWAVHFVVIYMLVEVACMGGQISFSLVEPQPLILITAALTLAALGLVAWRGLAAFRTWQRFPHDRRGDLSTESWAAHDRTSFMSLAGFLLSGFFALAILLVVLPFLLLQPCGGIGG